MAYKHCTRIKTALSAGMRLSEASSDCIFIYLDFILKKKNEVKSERFISKTEMMQS